MTITLQTFSSDIQRFTNRLVRYQGVSDRVLTEQLGVTVAQSYTLLAMPPTGSLTMNELSETLSLANSTMTRTVDQLVEKGLVERELDDEDRRVVRVRLSAQGQKAQAAVKEVLENFFKQALSDIPEEEREAVLHSFQTVTRAIAKGLATCCGQPIPGK